MTRLADMDQRNFETLHDYYLYPMDCYRGGLFEEAAKYWNLYQIRMCQSRALMAIKEDYSEQEVSEFLQKMKEYTKKSYFSN